jgi:IrrE N-terminal-like domain
MPDSVTLEPLYRRLKAVGFDRAFLQRAVLPDWWEDSLAANAATRSQIELHLAQRLGVPLADLRDSTQPLTLPGTNDVRLKRGKSDATRGDIAPGMIVARRTARIVLPHLRDVPPLPAHLAARDLRSWILARHRLVDLPALLDAAWEHGIAVFHFSTLPTPGRKFAGMAYYDDKRPIVILATGSDAPPRVAFYLAHEIAHILRGHVKPGGAMLADADFDRDAEDKEEREADGDALELLTGERHPAFSPKLGMTAARLVPQVRAYEREHGVHAGTVALIYGKTVNRMPVAIQALKLMNINAGARRLIADALRRRLFVDEAGLDSAAGVPSEVLEVLPVFGAE